MINYKYNRQGIFSESLSLPWPGLLDILIAILAVFILLISSFLISKSNFIVAASNVRKQLVIQERQQQVSDSLKSYFKRYHPKVEIQITSDGSVQKIRLPGELLFQSGSTKLNMVNLNVLNDIAKIISYFDEKKYFLSIEVEGHTDDVPVKESAPFKDNLELSALRAVEVVRFLNKQNIIKRAIISAVGKSFYEPYDDKNDENIIIQRALQRRIEIRLLYSI
ncbi:MAG: OmpA family protein [Candidatus Lokiarchaeota archaeon]|nr:OmpA family protein [Candidatus Lokiarchaeota archaeon]